MSFADAFRKSRPNLSDGTIRTYTSIARSLYSKILNEDALLRPKVDDVIAFFTKDYKRVLDALKDVDFTKRKTLLAALVVLTGIETESGRAYREVMLKDADAYNRYQREQKKSDKQTDNWVSQDYVMKVLRKLEQDTKSLWATPKQDLTMRDLQRMQDLLILSLYTLIPPRRILDYTAFKVRNIDRNVDNYMKGNSLIFNRYKTQGKYGQQVVTIPTKLKTLINKWTKLHDYDYLLFSEKGTPIPQSRLTQRLNRIFGGKNISVNMLRHIYISEKVLPDMPALERLEKTAEEMGHSTETQVLYKKLS